MKSIQGQNSYYFPINIDSLKKSGVDTFFIYKPYCYSERGYSVGGNATMREIECLNSYESFVFYLFKGNTYITKYNKCYKFNVLLNNQSTSIIYFKQHFQKLITDSIKDATFIDKKDGKTYLTGIDHSCYKNIYLSMNQCKFFIVDLYEFSKIVSGNETNINYSYNMNNPIKKFIDIVEAEIKTLKFTK